MSPRVRAARIGLLAIFLAVPMFSVGSRATAQTQTCVRATLRPLGKIGPVCTSVPEVADPRVHPLPVPDAPALPVPVPDVPPLPVP